MSEQKYERVGMVTVADILKEWVMVLLTTAFVSLYGLALAGKLRPLPDPSVVSRLEPVLFVVLGYYFGRLPAQQSEHTLKSEIERQTKRAEAAQQARETALQSRDALDEKVKNALTALASGRHFPDGNAEIVNDATTDINQHGSVVAALSILKS
ncbi:MAG TPA: hypothetical protein VJ875_13450 [Pyrinomonadaceae bacterium]|nr:hypothetical protein [Pyrinomonadaceae bacterium]